MQALYLALLGGVIQEEPQSLRAERRNLNLEPNTDKNGSGWEKSSAFSKLRQRKQTGAQEKFQSFGRGTESDI